MEEALVLLLAVRFQVVADLDGSAGCLRFFDEADFDGAVAVGDDHVRPRVVAVSLDDVALDGVVVLVALVGASTLAPLLLGLTLALDALVVGTVVAGRDRGCRCRGCQAARHPDHDRAAGWARVVGAG